MPQYRFIVEGDFVKFYDGTQHVMTLRNTAQDIDWYYTTSPGLSFELNGLPYKVENANEIEIDGVTLSANTEFDAAIIAIFPNLAGGGEGGGITTVGNVGAGDAKGAAITGSSIFMHKATETQPGLVSVDVTPQVFGGPKSFSGTVQFQNLATFESIQKLIAAAPPSTPPAGYGYLYVKTDKKLYFKNDAGTEFDLGAGGATPGIDDVLAVGQALTANRTVALNGKLLSFNQGAEFFLELDATPNAEQVNVKAVNLTGSSNVAHLQVKTLPTDAIFFLQADFNDGANRAQIEGVADNTTSLLTYLAVKHHITGNVGIGVEPTLLFQVNDGNNNLLSIDAVSFTSGITANDGNSESTIRVKADITDEVGFQMTAEDETNLVDITGNAALNRINYGAAQHNFSTGDIVIVALAGGGTTGLSVDNTGKLIRTP